MTFGHGNFDHFGADVIFAAPSAGTLDSLVAKYPEGFARITKTDSCKYKVQYSSGKTGAKVQYFGTHASAKSYANQYEPTGNVVDDSGSTTLAVDAVISDWSEWSECAGGIKTRTKTIVTPAECGGATPEDSELTEEGICCSDANATENADGSCACNEGYSMSVDGECIEVAGEVAPTDTTTDTTITAQSTDVTVAPASGMSGATKGLLAVLVIGGLVLSQR